MSRPPPRVLAKLVEEAAAAAAAASAAAAAAGGGDAPPLPPALLEAVEAAAAASAAAADALRREPPELEFPAEKKQRAEVAKIFQNGGDVLRKMMEFLSLEERERVFRRVNKEANREVGRMGRLSLRVATLVQLLALLRYASPLAGGGGTRFSQLAFSARSFMTDGDLCTVALSCPFLTRLEVYGCIGVSDFGLREVAHSCPRLTELEVVGCNRVTDAGLRMVAEHCPHLTFLRASGVSPAFQRALPRLLPDCKVEWL